MVFIPKPQFRGRKLALRTYFLLSNHKRRAQFPFHPQPGPTQTLACSGGSKPLKPIFKE